MPASYRIDADRGVILVSFEGEITLAEVLEVRRAMRADPAFPTTLREMIDLRAVTRFALTGEEIREIAEERESSHLVPPGRRVAIVASDDEAFGLARMYHGSRSAIPEEVHVVRDPAQAEAWLGLAP